MLTAITFAKKKLTRFTADLKAKIDSNWLFYVIACYYAWSEAFRLELVGFCVFYFLFFLFVIWPGNIIIHGKWISIQPMDFLNQKPILLHPVNDIRYSKMAILKLSASSWLNRMLSIAYSKPIFFSSIYAWFKLPFTPILKVSSINIVNLPKTEHSQQEITVQQFNDLLIHIFLFCLTLVSENNVYTNPKPKKH